MIVRGFLVVRPSASGRTVALGAGLALLLSAGPAPAKLIDLLGSTQGSPAIEILMAGAAAASSALPESSGGVAAAGGRSGVVPSSSAVPEPGVWALIILGFLGLGLGAQRKRKPRLTSLVD